MRNLKLASVCSCNFYAKSEARYWLLFYRRAKWDGLWTARQHLRTYAKQDFQIKCLGNKVGMDAAAAGWAPPAICGKSHLVSCQLRATKWHVASSSNFIVKWLHLLSRQVRVYKGRETEWTLLFLGDTIRMSRILQTSGNFHSRSGAPVLVRQQLKEAD